MAKDTDGFLWVGGDFGLLYYDGYTLKDIKDKVPHANISKVRKIFISDSDSLWIGTKGYGLFKITQSSIVHFDINSDIKDIIETKEGIWVASYEALILINKNNKLEKFYYSENADVQNIKITSLANLNSQELIIGTQKNVFKFNKGSHEFSKIRIENLKDTYINSLYKDSNNTLWITTDIGVFVKFKNSDVFQAFQKELINFRVNTLVVDEKHIWMGSVTKGLLKVSKHDRSIVYYKNELQKSPSLSGNIITAMVLNDDVLFVSTFYGGLNYFDTKAINFGLKSNTVNGVFCSASHIFYGFEMDAKGSNWISSNSGLIEYNAREKKCTYHNLNSQHKSTNYPLSSYLDSSNIRWVTKLKGLSKFNTKTSLFDDVFPSLADITINQIIEYKPHVFLLATQEGLFLLENNNPKKLSSKEPQLLNAQFTRIISTKDNGFYVASNKGVALLDENKQLSLMNKIQSQLQTQLILSLYMNKEKELWVGTDKNGLYKFAKNGDLLNRYTLENGVATHLSIFDILSHGKYLWISSNKGLMQLNTETDQAHTYHSSDGLQGEIFIRGSAYKTPDKQLYFSGHNGFNAFHPEDIKLNTNPPNIVLTDFTRFGKSVQVGRIKDNFLLPLSINDMNKLTLTHNDYVIGFEFAALDFADPNRNKYAYKMQGLDPDWIYGDASDRNISYSNLKPGDYTFRVRGTNKDGVWNKKGKSLSITVLPAPWLSGWAYAIYLVLIVAAIYCYMQWKNKNNIRITRILRFEVDKQTQALQVQKQKVENLLTKKNELFANVSHEFRTPLTLILGPINKLIKSRLPQEDINTLKMVNRNAGRLLTMIEQLLQLANISDPDCIKYYPIKVDYHINIIVTLFEHLADEKKIKLQLLRNDKAVINCSKDAVEIVLGNLLSNAIKYTQIGGEITVSSSLKEDKIYIKVSDTGCGLDKQQQKDIFNRFERLDSHRNIEGIGIGLSVVEEIIKANNANITIESALGQGSCFTVSFDISDEDSDKIEETREKSSQLLIKQLTQKTSSNPSYINKPQTTKNRHNETLLVIDDNDDMRSHIIDTLKDNYHCIQANGGKTGIALAIEHVPDIVICDVMMPGTDGFHVTRVLRNDTRTSHIPLMLLTALDDRESRIRGWREHVDVYLTKPFDAQELLIQLENILVIRNILKKKAGLSIRAGKKITHTDLPKKDQEFVNKLNQLIAKNYKNPLYLRIKIAGDMAVSERQLQRKLKALIDKNPMDLLREYRLNQAAIMLKDGYQVSITCEACGFNSLPHFSKCFKSQYGLSPKAYQSTCKQF